VFDDSLAGGSITLLSDVALPALNAGGSITLVGPPARVTITAGAGTQRTFKLSAAAAPGTFVEFKSLDFLGVVFDVTAAPSELRLTSASLVGTASVTAPAINLSGASAKAVLSGVTMRDFKGSGGIVATNSAEVEAAGVCGGRTRRRAGGRQAGLGEPTNARAPAPPVLLLRGTTLQLPHRSWGQLQPLRSQRRRALARLCFYRRAVPGM
jgi:hypothetical protein